ncbi:MAG TPA: hypothetical protein DC049_06250, partial [Spirochaetia bacterium]|nr:hypothetical protein [Spirochaetia bacterium]
NLHLLDILPAMNYNIYAIDGIKYDKMLTIKDIAQKAGCSVRTVSRVINNAVNVKEETRENIISITRQYKYSPDPLARSLKTKKRYTIGVILGAIDSDVNRERLETMTRLFNTAGYAMLVSRARDQETEDELIKRFIPRSDALVIFTNMRFPKTALLSAINKEDYPFFLIDPECRTDFPAVYINRASGYRDAVKYLAEKGRKHQLLALENNKRESRINGFKNGLLESGIIFKNEMIIEAETGFAGGRALTQIINNTSEPVNGIICQSDKMALGLVSGLLEKNLRVPEDISVIGFDNDNYSEYTTPQLTTIMQGGSSIGVYIYEQILEKIEHGIPIKSRIFDTKLIIRKSA